MLALILFALVAVVSLTVAFYAYAIDRRRQAILGRTLGGLETRAARRSLPTFPGAAEAERSGPAAAVRGRLRRLVPARWIADEATRERLIRAGFDPDVAAVPYASARLTLLVGLPLLTLLFEVGRPAGEVVAVAAIAVGVAWTVPRAMLDNRMRRRQERIRRGVPDALDLLLICVEAGVSLEGAMLRVSREMASVHPELTEELALLLRRAKAGVSREEALRGLYTRTGVDELRALASNIKQSERWGTSVVRMLRITAQTLRRKRRQAAEKKAATAALKMTVPLVLMILPPLFVVLLGPSALAILQTLTGQ